MGPPLFLLWGFISLSQSSSSSSSSNSFTDLCQVFGVTCPLPLKLTTSEAGIRGVFSCHDDAIPSKTTVLQIPLNICLRDDDDGPLSNANDDAPWSTRLASGVLQLQQRQLLAPTDGSTKSQAREEAWLALLPDADKLRASLPIHWDDDLINGMPPSLQAAVDASYFARADAVAQLQEHFSASFDERACHNALDVVQTRSCRVDDNGGELRILAPLFDMLNHGGTNGANAQFIRVEDNLVVQTTQPILAGSEVLIDYGGSARPAWRCLQSYGFVPASSSEDDVEPLTIDGIRYDAVGMESIPFELVEHISVDILGEPEVALTPEVCNYIADCADEAATSVVDAVDEQTSDDNAATVGISTAKRLVLELRQSRQRTLTAFARGLREYHNE